MTKNISETWPILDEAAREKRVLYFVAIPPIRRFYKKGFGDGETTVMKHLSGLGIQDSLEVENNHSDEWFNTTSFKATIYFYGGDVCGMVFEDQVARDLYRLYIGL